MLTKLSEPKGLLEMQKTLREELAPKLVAEALLTASQKSAGRFGMSITCEHHWVVWKYLNEYAALSERKAHDIILEWLAPYVKAGCFCNVLVRIAWRQHSRTARMDFVVSAEAC